MSTFDFLLSSPDPPQLHNLFHVGDYVIVDGTKRGFITSLDKETDCCDCFFPVEESSMKDVSLHRVQTTFLAFETELRNNKRRGIDIDESYSTNNYNSTTRTTATNLSTLPSLNLLNPNFIGEEKKKKPTSSTSPTPKELLLYQELKDSLKESISYQPAHKNPPPHPIVNFFAKYKNKQEGWIRGVIQKSEKEYQTLSSHLLTKHRVVLTLVSSIISAIPCKHKNFQSIHKYVRSAFGIKDKRTPKSIFKKFVDADFNMDKARKERTDKGASVFNCEKKRKATFTPFNTYKKHMHQKFRSDSSRIPEYELVENYAKLDDQDRKCYEILAARDYERSRHLWDDVCEYMKRTKGRIPYTFIATYLNNIVCVKTIQKFITEQPTYSMRRYKLLPSLDYAARIRRFRWASTYMKFWGFVKYIPPDRVRVVQVHMDEKWFYAIRSKSNQKIVTAFGMEPDDSYVHHRNHIDKCMYVVVTACVLNENNFEMGGTAVPISCIRVGKYERAKKDTYKRVYKRSGGFHYPKILANLLRSKGQLYFRSVELRGSKEGTRKQPKESLLRLYKEFIIPAIEKKICEKYSDNGKIKIIIVKQEDGAGVHTDKTYVREMKAIFKQRKWILFNQPPQSPMTNVHDACIFPQMSRAVSNIQASHFNHGLDETA